MYEFLKKLMQVLNFKRFRLLLRLKLYSIYPSVGSVVNQSFLEGESAYAKQMNLSG